MSHRKEYELLQTQFFQKMLKELGSEINSNSLILDFGCGEGWAVYQFRKQGLQAFGVDIENSYESVQKICKDEMLTQVNTEIFRTIEMDHYKIPFDDDMFDYVISDQVFEHVQNYPQAIAEIKRVIKPGGSSLHVIPSRYHPIEGHVFVPLATIFRGRSYLAFWAFLGIRNSFQRGMSWKEVADLNYKYLNNYTTYYKKSKIRELFMSQFRHISFVESVFIKHHHGRIHRYLFPLLQRFPATALFFSTFHSRVVFVRKWEASNNFKAPELSTVTVSQQP